MSAARRSRRLNRPPAGEHDQVRRFFDGLYRRLGGRVVLACLAGAVMLGLMTFVVSGMWGGRYLRLSISDVLLAYAITIPIVLPVVGAFLWRSRDSFVPVLSWSPGLGDAEHAPKLWNLVVAMPLLFVRLGLVVPTLAAVPAIGTFLLVSGRSITIGVGMFLIGWAGELAAVALAVFAVGLAMRPMLEDLAAYLPLDFEPDTAGWRLRTKALVPLPIVTLLSTLMAGAYVDLVARGTLRFVVALGIALVTIAASGAVFWVMVRSLLDPVDQLLAATRRVSAGDLTTPVPLTTADELGELASGFNQMLADLRQNADELQRQADALRASRERIVSTADAERRRLERDLHDGAQQHLVLLGLKLGLAERLTASDSAAAAKALREIRSDLNEALSALRDLAHGIYPAALENEGLPAALHEAVQRAAIPTELDVDGTHRYPPELEAAVYFCCLEALQNAAKHAGDGARATIHLSEHDATLHFRVVDNGEGFDPTQSEGSAGIQNMTDRVGALGGTLTIESTRGTGTTIAGAIPFGIAQRASNTADVTTRRATGTARSS